MPERLQLSQETASLPEELAFSNPPDLAPQKNHAHAAKKTLAKPSRELRLRQMKTVVNSPDPAQARRSAEHFSFQCFAFQHLGLSALPSPSFSPPSGSARGFCQRLCAKCRVILPLLGVMLFASACKKSQDHGSSSSAPFDRKVHDAASDGNNVIQTNTPDPGAELPKVPRSAEELVALLTDEKDYDKGSHLMSIWLSATGSFDEKVEMCIQLPPGQMRSTCYDFLCFDAIQNENPEQLFRLYESAPIGKDRARVAATLGLYITDKKGPKAGLDVVESFEFPEEKFQAIEGIYFRNLLGPLLPGTPEYETYRRIQEVLKPNHRHILDVFLQRQTNKNQP